MPLITQIDDFFSDLDKSLSEEDPYVLSHRAAPEVRRTILRNGIDSGIFLVTGWSPGKLGFELFVTDNSYVYWRERYGLLSAVRNPLPPVPAGIEPGIIIRGSHQFSWTDNRLDIVTRSTNGPTDRVMPRFAKKIDEPSSYKEAFEDLLRRVRISKPSFAVRTPKGLTL